MALDALVLKNLIKAEVDSIDFSNGSIDNDEVLLALATAIVTHITLAAEVVVATGSSSGTYPVL